MYTHDIYIYICMIYINVGITIRSIGDFSWGFPIVSARPAGGNLSKEPSARPSGGPQGRGPMDIRQYAQ